MQSMHGLWKDHPVAKTGSQLLETKSNVLQRLLPAGFSGQGENRALRPLTSLRPRRRRVAGLGCVSGCPMRTQNPILRSTGTLT